MASSRTPEITSWQEIDWPKVEMIVHALQRRIYRAQLQGNRRKQARSLEDEFPWQGAANGGAV